MDNKESAEQSEIPQLQAKETTNHRKKPAKVAPEAFLAKWKEAVSSPKDPVAKLRSMVRAGFQGEIDGGHVAQLVASVSEYRVIAERLALRLAVQARFGKLNKLSRRMLNELRAEFQERIDFDALDFKGYRASRAIEDWVIEHAPSGSDSDRDSWFRKFTVCLLDDSEPKTVMVGLLAASRSWASSSQIKSSAEDAAFVRGISLALSSPNIGASKIGLILAGVDAVNAELRKTLDHELDLERQIRTQQDSISSLNTRASVLEANLAESIADGAEKAAFIAELQQSLAAEEERYNLLDRHWRGVSEQELTKQSGAFREKVSQEVVEALLALDRENPSLEIALRRLRRIQEILAK
jgi:hypothetical protein